MVTKSRTSTAGDFRAMLGRLQIPRYQLAPRVGIIPSSLGRILNELDPLTPDMAQRMGLAINVIVKERVEAVSQT